MSDPRNIDRILVPTDFSDQARAAVDFAVSFAQQVKPVQVKLLHSYHIPVEIESFVSDYNSNLLDHMSEAAAKELEDTLFAFQDVGITAKYQVKQGSPRQVIIDVAEEDQTDLIIMGTHGRSGFAHAALGSIAELVVRRAPCPVITVKPS